MSTGPVGVQCANCGQQLTESPSTPENDRLPCPNCGSRARHFEFRFNERVGIYDKLKYNVCRSGLKKPYVEATNGWDLERKSGQWMRLRRVIDRRNDRYFEEIVDPRTGSVIHRCEERLTDHSNHGSAKQRPQPEHPGAG